jgi:hypothetical protein
MAKFSIELGDKPALSQLMNSDKAVFKEVVGTFVQLMEIAAEKEWYKLPNNIHSSLSFNDVVSGVLNAVMNTKEIDPSAYATLEYDLHPLALLSDQRKNLVTGSDEEYDWKSHFVLDSKEVSRETLEHIIRKMLYLVRWFDIESVSKSLLTNQFPMVDDKDIRKLPFQPALMYQKNHLGDLYIGKFFHDIGSFNCGEIEIDEHECPACHVGELTEVTNELTYQVCPRCNAGFTIKEELNF